MSGSASGAPRPAEPDQAGDPLREAASRLFTDLLTPAARDMLSQGELPPPLWAAVEELGLPASLLPDEAGGFGVPAADALSLLRVAGEHALPLPLAETMIARWLLARAGLTVPPGPLSLASGAELAWEAGTRVSGRAWDVAWGRHASAVVLVAPGPRGAAVLCLPRAALTVEAGASIAGDPSDSIEFRSVAAASGPAPVDADGFRAVGAATRALMIAGALGSVSAMAAQYAQERTQFGRAIGKFQAVQQNLAVLAGQAASARAAGDLAAEAVAAAGPRLIPVVAAAKVRAGEAAGTGAAIAHQVHGAIGFTEEHRLHTYTRRLWAWRDQYGREAEWAARLGRHLGAAGPDRLWSTLTEL